MLLVARPFVPFVASSHCSSATRLLRHAPALEELGHHAPHRAAADALQRGHRRGDHLGTPRPVVPSSSNKHPLVPSTRTPYLIFRTPVFVLKCWRWRPRENHRSFGRGTAQLTGCWLVKRNKSNKKANHSECMHVIRSSSKKKYISMHH